MFYCGHGAGWEDFEGFWQGKFGPRSACYALSHLSFKCVAGATRSKPLSPPCRLQHLIRLHNRIEPRLCTAVAAIAVRVELTD